MALKATWPQILYREEQYAQLVYQILRISTIGQDIWRCSIHPDDVRGLKFKSDFWKDVLISWSQYSYYDVMIIHSKYVKWRQDLKTEFCEGLVDFGRMHMDIYKLTNVAKFRSFQYRLNQRAIVTKVDLHKWGIMADNLCTFCSEEKETLIHLFVECKKVKELWSKIAQFVTIRYGIVPKIDATSIIFNRFHQRKTHVANFIWLLVKQFIYRQKCLKKEIDYPIVKAYIGKIENIEKYIAIKNDRFSVHNSKWSNVSNVTLNVNEIVMEFLEQ